MDIAGQGFMCSMIGVRSKRALIFVCCSMLIGSAGVVLAKPWRGIVPLRSKRADVRRILGKPIIGAAGSIELYERPEGRIQVMYARQPCERGLPADWGNWKVPRDTVVNISVTPHQAIPLKALKIRNIERHKWYTGESGATYYHDKQRGIEYQVQEGWVTAITYGPSARDRVLLCKKNVPLIRY
jgi:hypothetical protein